MRCKVCNMGLECCSFWNMPLVVFGGTATLGSDCFVSSSVAFLPPSRFFRVTVSFSCCEMSHDLIQSKKRLKVYICIFCENSRPLSSFYNVWFPDTDHCDLQLRCTKHFKSLWFTAQHLMKPHFSISPQWHGNLSPTCQTCSRTNVCTLSWHLRTTCTRAACCRRFTPTWIFQITLYILSISEEDNKCQPSVIYCPFVIALLQGAGV